MSAADSSSKMPLFLPQEALQMQNNISNRRASNNLLLPPSLAQPQVTPQNAASTWRTSECPFAPERRGNRPAASLEPTPTSSSVGGLLTPANLWPNMSPTGSPISGVTATSTTASASSGETRFAVRTAWPAFTGQRPSGLAAQLFTGDQSPFSVDMTPIAASGSGTTRSRKSSDFEWLAPVLDGQMQAANSESATPMSCASIGLNTARIFDIDSATTTPTNSCVLTGMESKDTGAFFMQMPMPDNGPSMRMREMGA